MKRKRAMKVRLYLNKTQTVLAKKILGCCRFIFNKMLNERKEVYEELKDNRRELYEHKYKTEKQYKEEFEFLKEADSTALQQAKRDLSQAFQKFFRRVKDKTVKEKGFPKFKKKHKKNSYRTPQNGGNLKIDFKKRKIHLPKLGWVSFRDPRNLTNFKITSVTVSCTPTGKFYASVQYEVDLPDPKKTDPKAKGLKVKGLDMSLANFFVDEEGNSPVYTRNYREAEEKMSNLQSRMDKETRKCRKNKLRMRIRRIQERTKNKRKDYIEKLSHELVEGNDVIVVETLSLKNMAQTFNLGKSVNDLGWSTFLQRLKVKAEERGKIVIEADKWFASSKTCNVCGFKNDELTLSDRAWTCPRCGTEHNRDMNAAINLKNYGLKIFSTAGYPADITAGTAGLAECPEGYSESQPSSVVE